MGKYDVITQGSINLIHPDPWGKALETFKGIYDSETERHDRREVRAEAQERYDEEQSIAAQDRLEEQKRYDEQQSIEAQDRFTEASRYSDQQDAESNRIKRDNWDFMYEEAENDAQRHAIYKDGLTHAVPGLTPGGLQTRKNAMLEEEQLELMLDKYNQGSPDYKNQHGPALISALIKNNKPVIANTIAKDYQEIKSEVQNAELIGLISTAYPDVITEKTKSWITQAGVLSDKQLDMVKSMIEANLETRKYSDERKADLINSIMTMSPPDDTASQKVIDTYHNLQALAATMLFELEGRGGKVELEPEPYPTYEDYETRIPEDSAYDQLEDEERKRRIFNQITEANAEEWGKMSGPEKQKAGDKIVETLSTTEYKARPKREGISPTTGVRYDVEFVERHSMKGITEKMITEKVNSLMKMIPDEQHTDIMKSRMRKQAIKLLKDERTNQYVKQLKSLKSEERELEKERYYQPFPMYVD